MTNATDGVNRRTAPELVVIGLTLRGVLGCLLGWALLGVERAEAHPEWSPIRVNRYAKVVLTEAGHARLVYTILYGEGPALPARKSVDLDANGRIDAREKALLGVRASAAISAGLRVTLDGAPVALPRPTVEVGLAGETVAPEPYSVDLTYLLDVPERREHELSVDDQVEVPSEGDTELSIEDTPALVAAWHGRPSPEAARQRKMLFTFRGPRFSVLEDRRVTLRYTPAGASLSARARGLAPLGGAVVALAFVGGAAVVRKRKKRRAVKGAGSIGAE